jgi:transcriptional regulator with XRE-family HTH domain
LLSFDSASSLGGTRLLGDRLREVREKKGLTITEAADLLESHFSTLSSYERGVRQPNPKALARLAAFYGVSVDWLLNTKPPEKSEEHTNEPGLTPKLEAELRRQLTEAKYSQHDIDIALSMLKRMEPDSTKSD